jgi:hypothetical protein
MPATRPSSEDRFMAEDFTNELSWATYEARFDTASAWTNHTNLGSLEGIYHELAEEICQYADRVFFGIDGRIL